MHARETERLLALTDTQRVLFKEGGFLSIPTLLKTPEVAALGRIYDRFISGDIAVQGLNKGDLSGSLELREGQQASVLQVLAPSLYCGELLESPVQRRALELARQLQGEDMIQDFEMLICKRPFEGRPTPWHQDEAYWPDLPDKRAVSCWVAIDAATPENGCMQFVPGSHLGPVLPHRRAHGDPNSRALETEVDPAAVVAVPLPSGGCTLHHGRTLHYTGPNTSDNWRRAYIVGFRPAAMVAELRSRGFYHYVPDPKSVVEPGEESIT